MRQCVLMQKDRWMDGGAGEPRTEERGVTFVAVQLLSRVRLSVTPWTAARQASLSFTISQSLLRLMAIESMTPSNHLILCCPFSSCPWSFPASREDLIPLSHRTQPSVPGSKFQVSTVVVVLGHSVRSDSATPWTVAQQAPPSMRFSKQEHWSRLPFPSPGDLPDPGIKPESLVCPVLASGFFTTA